MKKAELNGNMAAFVLVRPSGIFEPYAVSFRYNNQNGGSTHGKYGLVKSFAKTETKDGYEYSFSL